MRGYLWWWLLFLADFVLCTVFIALKVEGAISWSWWLVLLPILIVSGISLICLVFIGGILAAFAESLLFWVCLGCCGLACFVFVCTAKLANPDFSHWTAVLSPMYFALLVFLSVHPPSVARWPKYEDLWHLEDYSLSVSKFMQHMTQTPLALALCFFILLGLKLDGYIDIPWPYVYIPLGMTVLFFLITAVAANQVGVNSRSDWFAFSFFYGCVMAFVGLVVLKQAQLFDLKVYYCFIPLWIASIGFFIVIVAIANRW